MPNLGSHLRASEIWIVIRVQSRSVRTRDCWTTFNEIDMVFDHQLILPKYCNKRFRLRMFHWCSMLIVSAVCLSEEDAHSIDILYFEITGDIRGWVHHSSTPMSWRWLQWILPNFSFCCVEIGNEIWHWTDRHWIWGAVWYEFKSFGTSHQTPERIIRSKT